MRSPPDPLLTLATVFPRQLSYKASRTMLVLKQLREFENLPVPSQDALLAPQLAHLLSFAKSRSPFWAERLAAWTPEANSCAGHLQAIPPLLRSEIRVQKERLQTRMHTRSALGSGWVTTSGSTGTPVRVEHLQKLYGPVYLAATLLLEDWYGLNPSRPMGTLRSTVKDNDNARLGPPSSWRGPTAIGFNFCTRDRQTPELYDHCARQNPAYLLCGPTAAFEMARYALKTGRRDLRPELILTIGWAVTGEIRDTVREGLGARIIDRYSCEETGYIAMQCPTHDDHLHVVSPLTFVEIVDAEGRPCPPGQPGRVLLTAMQSYGMPLIRYDIGDVAVWGEPAGCGITLPVIKEIWGRSSHLLTHPDGKEGFVRIYARDFQDIPGLEEYRFVLHQSSVIAAQIRSSAPSPQTDALITERIQRAVGYAYPVRIAYVDKIDWGSNWKQENFAISSAPPPESNSQ